MAKTSFISQIFDGLCDLKEFELQQKNLSLIFESFFHRTKDLNFD
jgi:hypothetical protein